MMFSLAEFYQNFYQPMINYDAINYGHEQAAAAAAIIARQYQLQQLQQLQHLQMQHQQEQLQHQLSPILTQQQPPPLAHLHQLPLPSPVQSHIQPVSQHQLQEQQLLQQQSQQLEQTCNIPMGGNGDPRGQANGTIKRSRPKKYKCPYCWVSLSNTGQFKGHLRIHTGERPFVCDHASCGKSFTRNEELTRHKRIHTGLRPYSCIRCNKCFGRKDHLKKHTRTHDRQDNSTSGLEASDNNENDNTASNFTTSDNDNDTPSPATCNDNLAFSIENLMKRENEAEAPSGAQFVF